MLDFAILQITNFMKKLIHDIFVDFAEYKMIRFQVNDKLFVPKI